MIKFVAAVETKVTIKKLLGQILVLGVFVIVCPWDASPDVAGVEFGQCFPEGRMEKRPLQYAHMIPLLQGPTLHHLLGTVSTTTIIHTTSSSSS